MNVREIMDYITQFLVVNACLVVVGAHDWVIVIVVSTYIGLLATIALFEEEEE